MEDVAVWPHAVRSLPSAGRPANLSLTTKVRMSLRSVGSCDASSDGRAPRKLPLRGGFTSAPSQRHTSLSAQGDPLNGFWLYKCLKEVGEPPVQPLRSMGEGEAHNMACISAWPLPPAFQLHRRIFSRRSVLGAMSPPCCAGSGRQPRHSKERRTHGVADRTRVHPPGVREVAQPG